MPFGRWRGAAEFFAEVADKADSLYRITGRLDLMEMREGVRAQGYSPRVSGTRADVNGTDAAVALMDYERAHDRDVAECERLLALSMVVTGNLRRFVPAHKARALEFFYQDRRKRAWIALALHCSASTADAWRAEALRACDLAGFEELTRGDA